MLVTAGVIGAPSWLSLTARDRKVPEPVLDGHSPSSPDCASICAPAPMTRSNYASA